MDNNLIEESFYLDREKPIEITQRNLPHWHQDNKLQFITFHLYDSIPRQAAEELAGRRKRWLEENPFPHNQEQHLEYLKLFSKQSQVWLDNGYGSCALRNPDIASVVAETLRYFDGKRYRLIAFVVMPNHVHVLIHLYPGEKNDAITRSWKAHTAVRINKMLNRKGRLWHHESWDTLIRDENHYKSVLNYIYNNIRKGGIIWMQ